MTMDQVQRVAPSVFATAPHEGVSDKYRFIPTIEMLNTLTKQGWEVVQAGEHRVRLASKKGFQKHMLRLRNPSLPKVGDSEIDLVVMNSHDRTSAYRFLGGLFRGVCANGLVAGENLFAPISIKHVGYSADNVIEASYRLIDSIPQISQSVDSMRSMMLSDQERLAFAESALTVRYGEASADNVIPIGASKLLLHRRHEDASKDLWTTFNVIQENLIRGGLRDYSKPRNVRRTTRGVGSISENTKLNQALWTLTEKMKELKA